MSTPTAEPTAGPTAGPGPDRGVQRFELTDPLAPGTTLLEASAGTGKTYTIAALATRYLAEGAATVDQLLMITFGRNATRELRERVRERLVQTRDALLLAHPERSPDPIVALLATTPGPAVAATRLGQALADFDTATIATTHQFCQGALAGLGIAADRDPGETFVEDLQPLISEALEDLLVATHRVDRPGLAQLSAADAAAIARAAIHDPQADLDVGPLERDTEPDVRVRFAQAVRRIVTERRRVRRQVTFDDLVSRMAATLRDPVTGAHACARLRRQYRVVLVDEFQDTDPEQWEIVRRAFHGHVTVILIGDPKQAIYAFRGADVYSYLDAAAAADRIATLPTNFRSDAAVVDGVAELLGTSQLGDPRIVVRPITAHRAGSRLTGLAHPQRVRLRQIVPDDDAPLLVGPARTAVAADVAADVVALLSGPARLRPHPDLPERTLAPGDIAVLTATNPQARIVHAALQRVGVPAVTAGVTSVFATPAAGQWRDLLRALESPRGRTLRPAALTDFLGYTGAELAVGGDALDEAVAERLREWSRVLSEHGMAALVAVLSAESGVMARVLSRPDGERTLTDLRHLASALSVQQRETRWGPKALLDWLELQSQRSAGEAREQTTSRTRRLESDAAAVQILTVHAAKGLEFPVTYVPFGWDRNEGKPTTITSHVTGDGGPRRVLDVRNPKSREVRGALATMSAEQAGESLRLLYVALTRASSLVVLHWAPSKYNAPAAPLHRLLCARGTHQVDPDLRYPAIAPPPTDWLKASTTVRLEQVSATPPDATWSPAAEGAALPELDAAPYDRQVDTRWRRTSYSGLTAGLHEQGRPESAPVDHREDEPPDDQSLGSELEVLDSSGGAVPPASGDGAAPTPSLFGELPAGAAFGTLVHGILELVDTDAPDLAAEVTAQVTGALSRRPFPGVSAPTLATALTGALTTPLGPLADGLHLGDLARADRLPELDFELPLAQEHGHTLGDVAALLRRHLPAEDPMAAYSAALAAEPLGSSLLTGSLTGSIDAVLRVRRDPAAPPAHLVVDYKTNLLRDPREAGVEQLVRGYRPSVLPAAMIGAHYPLQALLYCVALHRYLRWRQPGYDPTVHLGGVLYLFVRGMAGPATPTEDGIPCGVFSWRPPAALVLDLSDLLDGARP